MIMNYEFSFKQWEKLPFDKYEKNFKFIVDGKEYYTSRIIADIFSPTIRNYHYTDESADEFCINTPYVHSKSKEDYFSEIINLINSNKITIKDENKLAYYAIIFQALGNDEESFKFHPIFDEKLSTKNVIKRTQSLLKYYSAYNESNVNSIIPYKLKGIKEEIDFISTHFSDIDQKEIQKLDLSIIELIITNDNFQVSEEDNLLQFLLELYEKDRKSSFLFQYVIFSNITNEMMNNFISVFDLNDIDGTIWESICKRLINTKPKTNVDATKDQRCNRIKFLDDNYLNSADKYGTINLEFNKEMEGVFYFLTNETKGNIYSNDTIDINTNSRMNNINYHAKNLVDFGCNTYWDSGPGKFDKYVCFDLKNCRLKPTAYSIRTINNADFSLKNWSVQISNDGENWIEIDRKKNNRSLVGPLVTKSFVVKESNFARYIMFTHFGPDWRGNYDISISSIEFYGVLKFPKI